ncbi:MAG TPA: hypothetical protein VIG71_00320 [Enteractinococcus sp.]
MTIIRMYHTVEGSKRPTHYREAWWEPEAAEFVLHHGPVGETGKTTVEKVSDESEAELLLASFEQQNITDQYIDADSIDHESFKIKIKFKGAKPTQIESRNAEKFSIEYSGLLGWRGLGIVDEVQPAPNEAAFLLTVHTVHSKKAIKLAHEALKKTDIRADRMRIEQD